MRLIGRESSRVLRYFGTFIILFLLYEFTPLHLTVSNFLGYKGHGRDDIYQYQQEDFLRVSEICARNRLRHFRKACEKMPRNSENDILIDELLSVRGLIHDKHKLVIQAFPKSGSEEMKMALYNHTTRYTRTEEIEDKLSPEAYGYHRFEDEKYRKDILNKISVFGVVLTVQHPLKRIEEEYNGLLQSSDTYRDMSFSKYVEEVLKGKHEDTLRPYADFCATIDDLDFVARSEMGSVDVEFLSKRFLKAEVEEEKFQVTGFDSSPNFHLNLPLFSALENPSGVIKELSDHLKDMEMLQYTYNIDSKGKVTGSCEITSHGVCC